MAKIDEAPSFQRTASGPTCLWVQWLFSAMLDASLRTAILALVCLLLSGCTVGRFFIYNFADTNDYRKFPSRELPASPDPVHYAEVAKEKSLKAVTKKGEEIPLEDFLADHKTVAFLVIQRDTVVYERYFKGYDPSRSHTSFSVAKSVISILIGCAIKDGMITGVDQPVTDFIPELRENGFEKVTVEHLLQLTSGLKFNESYFNPFGDAATFYYGRRLYKSMARMKLKAAPGTHFEYQSGSSQLLGFVMERALRNANDPRTITEYLNDKLWSPLGMEYPASWRHRPEGRRHRKDILLHQCSRTRLCQARFPLLAQGRMARKTVGPRGMGGAKHPRGHDQWK